MEQRVKDYIEQISRLLPYKREKKQLILDSLYEEVMEAMRESTHTDTDPVAVYGEARQVAKNVSTSQEWGTKASFKRRTGAYVLDTVIFTGITSPLCLVLSLMYLDLLIPEPIIPVLFEIFSHIQSDLSVFWGLFWGIATFSIMIIGIALLFVPIYFMILEGLFSTTLGKKILGLKVCDVSGIKITLKQSIIRNLSKFSPVLLILDIIVGRIAKSKEKKRILDLIAETKVLKM